jgi:transcription initiation factor TFIID TATA-box-binding protein
MIKVAGGVQSKFTNAIIKNIGKGHQMKISNIVATVKLAAPIDIGYLNQNIPGTVKDPKVHWLKYRIPENNSYVAFYQSGKFLITAKSFEQIDKNVKYVLAVLKKIGISTNDWKLEIHNLVIGDTIDLPCTIEQLVANMDAKKSSFEPEQFAALIYKDWGVSFLLFSTGKVILTGAKSLKQADDVLVKLRRLLKDLS